MFDNNKKKSWKQCALKVFFQTSSLALSPTRYTVRCFFCQNSVLTSLPACCVGLCVCVCVCVCVCGFELLWGHPVWVFLLQCSFRLRNSSFSVDGAYGSAHSASLAPLTRPHMQTQEQTRFRLCCVGQVTDRGAFWDWALLWTEVKHWKKKLKC